MQNAAPVAAVAFDVIDTLIDLDPPCDQLAAMAGLATVSLPR